MSKMQKTVFDTPQLIVDVPKFTHVQSVSIVLTSQDKSPNPGNSRTLTTFQAKIKKRELNEFAACAYINAGLMAGGYSRKTLDMPNRLGNNGKMWLFKPVRVLYYNHIDYNPYEAYEDYCDDNDELMWDKLEREGYVHYWNPEEDLFHTSIIFNEDDLNSDHNTDKYIIYVRYKSIAEAMNNQTKKSLFNVFWFSDILNKDEISFDEIINSNIAIEFKGLEDDDPVDYSIKDIIEKLNKGFLVHQHE